MQQVSDEMRRRLRSTVLKDLVDFLERYRGEIRIKTAEE